jgi:hypothetical protein
MRTVFRRIEYVITRSDNAASEGLQGNGTACACPVAAETCFEVATISVLQAG